MAKGVKRTIGIYINGKEVENDIKSITSAMLLLTNQQKKMTIGSDEYIKHAAKIRELREIIEAHNQSLKTTANSWDKLMERVSRLGNAVSGFKNFIDIFNSSVSNLKQLAKDAAAMDDIYATVRKTTNLTREEVLELNEAFKKMDTRTSREELNALAETAGRLGISAKEDVMRFVEAADIINVALGDVLGENAIRDIGKMADVFSKVQTDLQGLNLKEQMLGVANVVNELGKTSTANEQYLVNFAGRLGGVATQAKISIQNVLGFGSALDQNMQRVEMSATAIQKFIMKLMSDPAKFAKIAGLEVEKFSRLLDTDANAAIKTVIRAMGEKGGFQQLIPIFKDMGLDGARAVGVLSALATNMDKVDEAQRIANQAFIDGNSALDEYAIKNNNLQAELEKARKRFTDTRLELGEKLYPVLLKLTKTSTASIKALGKLADFVSENKGLVLTLAAAWGVFVLYLTRAKLASIAELAVEKISAPFRVARLVAITKLNAAKLKNVAATQAETLAEMNKRMATLSGIAADNQYRAILAQETLVKQANTAATAAQTRATQALSLAKKATPWGLVLAAATALAIAIYKLATRTTEAEKAMKDFNKQCAVEKQRVDDLFDRLKNLTKGTEEYNEVQQEIINSYGSILKHQIDEEGNLKDLEVAYNLVTRAIERNIALKTQSAKIEEIVSNSMDKQQKYLKAFKPQYQKYIKDLADEGKSAEQIIDSLNKKFGTAFQSKKWETKTRYVGETWVSYDTEVETTEYGKIKQLINEITKSKGDIQVIKDMFNPFIEVGNADELERLEASLEKLKQKQDELKGGKKWEKEAVAERIKDTEKQIDLFKRQQQIRASELKLNKLTLEIQTVKDEKIRKSMESQIASHKKIIELQKEAIQRISGKTNKVDDTTPDPTADSAKENYLREKEAFYKSVADLREKALTAQMKDFEKEIYETEKQYNELIKGAKKYRDKKLAAELENEKSAALYEITVNHAKKYQEAIEKIAEKQKDLSAKGETNPLISALAGNQKQWQGVISEIDKTIEALTELQAKTDDPTQKANINEMLTGLNSQRSAATAQQQTDSSAIVEKEIKRITLIVKEEKEKQLFEIREKYDKEIEIVRAAIAKEQELGAEANEEKIAEYNALIEKLLAKQQEELDAKKGETWVMKMFGLSNDDMKDLNKQIGKITQTMQKFADQSFDIVNKFNQRKSNLEQKEFNEFAKLKDAEIKKLDEQFDKGLISKGAYEKKKEEINAEVADKELEMKREQFKREKNAATINAIIQGALAIVTCFAQLGPIAGAIAAAVVAVGTAAEIAVIQSQPEPYARGGYIKTEKIIRAGEAGEEWVASNTLLRNPETAPVIEALEKYQRGDKNKFNALGFSMPSYSLANDAELLSRVYPSNNSTTGKETLHINEMAKNIEKLTAYMSDPKNRQAVITRKIQTNFESEEQMLRNLANL